MAEKERLARLDAEAKGKQALENLAAAEVQRDRADRNFDLARKAVEHYLVEVTDDESLKQSNFHDLRGRLLELTVPFYEQFLRKPADDHHVQAEQAHASGRLADIWLETGKSERALVLLDESLAVWEQLVEQFPDDPEMANGLVISLERIGRRKHLLG